MSAPTNLYLADAEALVGWSASRLPWRRRAQLREAQISALIALVHAIERHADEANSHLNVAAAAIATLAQPVTELQDILDGSV